MLTDELQMYCLEKSEHASVAAKIVLVLFLSSKKNPVKYRAKIPRVEAQDRGMRELNFHCFGSKAFFVI